MFVARQVSRRCCCNNSYTKAALWFYFSSVFIISFATFWCSEFCGAPTVRTSLRQRRLAEHDELHS